MFGHVNNLPPEDRFTRTVFGIIMIAAAFISWGRWVTLVLGVLFLISAWQGYCVTCELYKKCQIRKKNNSNQ